MACWDLSALLLKEQASLFLLALPIPLVHTPAWSWGLVALQTLLVDSSHQSMFSPMQLHVTTYSSMAAAVPAGHPEYPGQDQLLTGLQQMTKCRQLYTHFLTTFLW